MSRLTTVIIAGSTFQFFSLLAFGQGSLTPPGAPAETMQTLDQLGSKADEANTKLDGLSSKADSRGTISSLPFNISASGSYRVTGNLVGAAGHDGIVIAADNVTVDLGGFELVGAGTGTAIGVRVVLNHTNVTIRNGTVRGWPGSGIGFDSISCVGTRVEEVRALSNGAAGIAVGPHAVVQDCAVRGNASTGVTAGSESHVAGVIAVGNSYIGILTGSNAVVRNCIASSNGSGSGISVGNNSTISNCTSNSNSGSGFSCSFAATFQNCSAQNNTGSGFFGGDAIVLTGCAVTSNTGGGVFVQSGATITRCSLNGNGSDGILAGTGSVIEECSVQENSGDGIHVSSSCLILANKCDGNGFLAGDGAGIHTTGNGNRIEGNAVSYNDRGIDVDSGGSVIVRNAARTNGTSSAGNYSIAADNRYGPIIDDTAAGTVAAAGKGPFASTIATTDPWANFSY